MNVYVVYGMSGEYSDRSEWNVCAYLDEEKAKLHVINAQQAARELELKWADNIWEMPDGQNPFDLKMQWDSNGVRYSYAPVEVADWLSATYKPSDK